MPLFPFICFFSVHFCVFVRGNRQGECIFAVDWIWHFKSFNKFFRIFVCSLWNYVRSIQNGIKIWFIIGKVSKLQEKGSILKSCSFLFTLAAAIWFCSCLKNFILSFNGSCDPCDRGCYSCFEDESPGVTFKNIFRYSSQLFFNLLFVTSFS